MGFRYRKSINLGGGFRINLSKSGIGYSWGVKGYRITKTAKGTRRKTLSIPGTGISFVDETGKNNSAKSNRGICPAASSQTPVIDNNHYDTQSIINNDAAAMVSEGLEDMLAAASRAVRLYTIAFIGLVATLIIGLFNPIFLLLTAAFLIMSFVVFTKGAIELDYNIDPDQQSIVDTQMKPLIQLTKCSRVWRITQASKVIDKKYASGASKAINRTLCKTDTKAPFPFKANIQVLSLKSGTETLLFLPDKLLIIQGSKIGALNYSDIEIVSDTAQFIETEGVPKDSRIVGHTWEYVNKSGGPDKRFKNNRQLPICQYGKLELRSPSGLNTIIMYSNPSISIQLK